MRIPRYVWLCAFVFMATLHTALLIYLASDRAINLEQNLGGFDYPIKNDKFESIMIISDLPIGEFKEVAPNAQKSNVPEPPQEQETLKEPEISSLEDIKSEIEVVKKPEQKTIKKIKPKIKPKKEVKKPLETARETDKKTDDAKNDMNSDSNINSVAKDNVASAPISGDGGKITSAGGGAGVAVKKSWQGLVVSHLNKHKKYPEEALLNGLEGVVFVKVRITRNGEVLDAVLTKGSKFEILNDEATRLFSRASPLPPPPNEIANSADELTLNFPIEFNIKKYKASRK